MNVTEETRKRYELLEELLSINEPFGFSIPELTVQELLLHNKREYRIYYQDRELPFIIARYDHHQNDVTRVEIDNAIASELMSDNDRFESIIEHLKIRISQKCQNNKPINLDPDGELARKTEELISLTHKISLEISTVKRRETIQKTLIEVQEKLTKITQEIEQQKIENLENTISSYQKN